MQTLKLLRLVRSGKYLECSNKIFGLGKPLIILDFGSFWWFPFCLNDRLQQAKYIKEGTKTKAGIRKIPMYTVLKETLAMLMKTSKSEYLFLMRDGNLYSKTAINRMWQQILKKINKDREEDNQINITSHYLRHTYATDLYYANVDLKTAQYLLGHEDIKTTLSIYTSLRLDTDTVLDKLTKYFSQSEVSQTDDSGQKNAASELTKTAL